MRDTSENYKETSMTFDEWLMTPKGQSLFISKDSKMYNLYKDLWDEAQKHTPQPKKKEKKNGKK